MVEIKSVNIFNIIHDIDLLNREIAFLFYFSNVLS